MLRHARLRPDASEAGNLLFLSQEIRIHPIWFAMTVGVPLPNLLFVFCLFVCNKLIKNFLVIEFSGKNGVSLCSLADQFTGVHSAANL